MAESFCDKIIIGPGLLFAVSPKLFVGPARRCMSTI